MLEQLCRSFLRHLYVLSKKGICPSLLLEYLIFWEYRYKRSGISSMDIRYTYSLQSVHIQLITVLISPKSLPRRVGKSKRRLKSLFSASVGLGSQSVTVVEKTNLSLGILLCTGPYHSRVPSAMHRTRSSRVQVCQPLLSVCSSQVPGVRKADLMINLLSELEKQRQTFLDGYGCVGAGLRRRILIARCNSFDHIPLKVYLEEKFNITSIDE